MKFRNLGGGVHESEDGRFRIVQTGRRGGRPRYQVYLDGVAIPGDDRTRMEAYRTARDKADDLSGRKLTRVGQRAVITPPGSEYTDEDREFLMEMERWIRATDPKELKKHPGHVRRGERRGDIALKRAAKADLVVCAWGAHETWGRDREFLDMIDRRATYLTCLGTTKGGCPKHPLYVKADARLVSYGG